MSTRAAARSTLGWAFGMAATILFLALWGRAVVIDTDTLAESMRPMSGSGVLTGLVSDWMADELVESGADPDTVEPTVDYLLESSSVGATLDQLVVEVVQAAASSDPDGSRIDVAALIGPTVPELTVGLSSLGYPVTQVDVSNVVEGLDPLVIRHPGAEAVVGPSSPTAARLGTAALLAVIALLVFGFGVVAVSEDRVAAVRGLLTRVAVGGVSFAVFLRVGSWVLDPSGGRAPVQSTISEVARSKWAVPLEIALVAGILAVAIYLGRRWLRRRGGSHSPDGRPTPQPEQSKSLSVSR